MTAETLPLPNLRKMFVPDEGYTIIDVDLERADAQVVAWEAGDEELKQMFREGADIHTENAKTIFKLRQEPTYQERQKAKQGCHAVNYGCSARTLAPYLGSTVKDAEDFINRWLSAHPKIKNWHDRVMFELRTERSVKNAFGFRIYFFDRVDVKLRNQALAWLPQSTVGIVTNKGLVNIDENLSGEWDVELLLQVHDSLVCQAPTQYCPQVFDKILEQMRVEVPYDDPLYIPNTLEASEKSWGDVIAHEKWLKAHGYEVTA